MRNTLKLYVILAALAVPLVAQSGSESKGKYYFKKSCKSCHTPGGNTALPDDTLLQMATNYHAAP